MATAGGGDRSDLRERLTEEGWRFDFFQAVRLMQRDLDGGAPVGTTDDPARERIRFHSDVSLSFPATEVGGISRGDAVDDPWELQVNFMGVATPASYGSLPLPYAELILELKRDRSRVLRDFLDLFNHRLISLFYRAWEKYRYAVVYERLGPGESGLFERCMMSLLGMGTPGMTGRLAMDDRALMARAHALVRRGISARGLADLVRDYFGVPARVRQFVPHWYTIEEEERTRLGRRSNRLGVDAVLGERVPMAQTRFRVVLGPLGWERLCDFLPTGSAFGPLAELCSMAAGPEYDFEFQFVLDAGSAPGLRLGSDQAGQAPLLGWSTWLHTDELTEDADDVIIDGEVHAVAAGSYAVAAG